VIIESHSKAGTGTWKDDRPPWNRKKVENRTIEGEKKTHLSRKERTNVATEGGKNKRKRKGGKQSSLY